MFSAILLLAICPTETRVERTVTKTSCVRCAVVAVETKTTTVKAGRHRSVMTSRRVLGSPTPIQ